MRRQLIRSVVMAMRGPNRFPSVSSAGAALPPVGVAVRQHAAAGNTRCLRRVSPETCSYNVVCRPQGGAITYTGDPLQDFTLMRFLDRFVFRNPKQMKGKRERVGETFDWNLTFQEFDDFSLFCRKHRKCRSCSGETDVCCVCSR